MDLFAGIRDNAGQVSITTVNQHINEETFAELAASSLLEMLAPAHRSRP